MQSPFQAATLVEINTTDGKGTRDLRDLQIGEYCYVNVGEKITPQYDSYLYSKMNYHTTPSGIAIDEKVEKMVKRPTDFHMAPSAAMEWCFERIAPVEREIPDPWNEGEMLKLETPSYKLYPSMNYYGVNYNLDGGSWEESTDWIETKMAKTMVSGNQQKTNMIRVEIYIKTTYGLLMRTLRSYCPA